ncbi:isoprenoid biosynthesis protein with amidotransferase-like domain [Klebsiella variicola]|nr:isoprenoid biosynthesis glyoxalase ElbB [Klebsiella variicola]CTQ18570.1 isoprenoid biosynthesis protein with amidotransferase-like domain [Klebsiella variicola]
MKKIGVVLSGCGVYDGSEIHEAVITLLAIARNGAQAVCFAPDKPQRDVINHLTGEPLTEQRNVLVEAARIARGDILPLTQARAETLDALIVPGGFGAAKNLSSFAAEGSECQVDRDLQALALAMHQAGKPLGFMCIAPALLPKIFAFPLRITIGTDLDTADVVEEMGASTCLVRSTTSWWMKRTKWSPPAYMLAENIAQAATGIEKLVARVLALSA